MPNSTPRENSPLSGTLIALVAVFWLLIALTWGTQRHVSAALLGGSVGWGSHLAYGLWSSIPWIPVSLGMMLIG